MKILIFGPSGAGKTTLAREVSREFSIPHFDLDSLFFQIERGQGVFMEKRSELLRSVLKENQKWIIEGMYRDDWLDDVIRDADTIFIFLPPLYVNIIRLLRRSFPRILKRESFERETNLSILWYLLKIRIFFKKRVQEFEGRVQKQGKNSVVISNKEDFLRELRK